MRRQRVQQPWSCSHSSRCRKRGFRYTLIRRPYGLTRSLLIPLCRAGRLDDELAVIAVAVRLDGDSGQIADAALAAAEQIWAALQPSTAATLDPAGRDNGGLAEASVAADDKFF